MIVHTSNATQVHKLVLTMAADGIGVGKVRVTAVEAVPAQPQNAGAGQRHQQAIRRKVVAILLDARPDHRRRDKPGGAGGEMDHITAGEVEGTQLRRASRHPKC